MKEYAARTIDDYSTVAMQAQAVAQKKNIVPDDNASSSALKSDSDDILDELDRRSGVAYDRTYLEEEILSQLKAMAVVDQSARFEYDGNVGYGLYEHAFSGSWPQYGLE